MGIEDEREAVKLSVTLSNQLVAAALAMIAVEGAFSVFVIGNRLVSNWFFLFALLTFAFFVASIFVGGKGTSASCSSGFKGKWSLEAGTKRFNLQAIFCLVALSAFIFTLFLSNPKETQFQKDVRALKEDVQSTKDQLNNALSQIHALKSNIEKLRNEQDKQYLKKTKGNKINVK